MKREKALKFSKEVEVERSVKLSIMGGTYEREKGKISAVIYRHFLKSRRPSVLRIEGSTDGTSLHQKKRISFYRGGRDKKKDQCHRCSCSVLKYE